MKIIIPARRNSKGLPFKNRTLFKKTADIIPVSHKNIVYVVTDDEKIKEMANSYGFNTLDRPSSVSSDEASTKELMIYIIDKLKLRDEKIVMLYLTYPSRKWSDVEKALEEFDKNKCQSLLCKLPLKTSPFLILKEENDNRGSQLFYHNLYRRQDYPKCFELSHYVCILNSSEINKLNNNLYNNLTYFLPIWGDVIDVDHKEDLEKYERQQ
jgi:CMP-N-acetylneuraminic acid synthetase